MSERRVKNLSASIRQRLLNLAGARDEDFQLTLTRFGLERLLYRLSRSRHVDRFLLKGAMLFSVWSTEVYRPTRDLDLAGSGDSNPDHVKDLFDDLCRIDVEPDGLEFPPESIRVHKIREPSEYMGVRVRLEGRMHTTRIPLQVDIGFGDAVTPEPTQITYPTLLDLPAPRLRAYPPETVVAEKFQAMVILGIANTRMKDFYDLWMLAKECDFDRAQLASAITATFERRKTPLPDGLPIALQQEFWHSKDSEWSAFLKKSGLGEGIQLKDVIQRLTDFIEPALDESRQRGRVPD
jgi:predicted nucleotidyltransferase component of viral defense system